MRILITRGRAVLVVLGACWQSIWILDILPALKGGDSLYRTAMPDRKNVLGRIDVAVVSDTTLTASPFSYSQT